MATKPKFVLTKHFPYDEKKKKMAEKNMFSAQIFIMLIRVFLSVVRGK